MRGSLQWTQLSSGSLLLTGAEGKMKALPGGRSGNNDTCVAYARDTGKDNNLLLFKSRVKLACASWLFSVTFSPLSCLPFEHVFW